MSVNLGRARPTEHSSTGRTAIDKLPAAGPVELRAPDPGGTGGSGLVGDEVCDLRFHGGADRAVYAYAREDLDHWTAELGRTLRCGTFGENLTTIGLDLTTALIGERWQIGKEALLEVSMPRIPCRTFAGWLGERGWLRTFTQRCRPGALLRVLHPGRVEPGDRVSVVFRPAHAVTVGLTFRAVTTEPSLLPRLHVADALAGEVKQRVQRRIADEQRT